MTRAKRKTARKKTARKQPKISVDKKLTEELAKWGIDRKAIGGALLVILITAILHQLGVGYSLSEGTKMSEEDVEVEAILETLKEENSLDEITGKIPKEIVVSALREIVRKNGILWDYEQEDIPPKYAARLAKIDRNLIEFLLSAKRKRT